LRKTIPINNEVFLQRVFFLQHSHFYQVIDKREVVFRDRRTELLFPGSGQPLDNNKEAVGSDTTKVHSLESVKETGMFSYINLVFLE
jgi:hypothetical protein